MVASMILLSISMKTLPLGTAYSVWTGIGAAGAFIFGIVILGEQASLGRIAAAVLIVSGLILMKLSDNSSVEPLVARQRRPGGEGERRQRDQVGDGDGAQSTGGIAVDGVEAQEACDVDRRRQQRGGSHRTATRLAHRQRMPTSASSTARWRISTSSVESVGAMP